MCYHAEFGPSTSKGVNINKRIPKNWESWGAAPLGLEAWLTPKTRGTYLDYNITAE